MEPVMEDELMHYGVKRRSGRYPWGSGDSPFQRSGDFLSRVNDLKKQGMTEKEIVKDLGFESTTQYRRYYTIANNERKKLNIDRAKSLAEDGLGASEIGRKMGVRESTVRSWLSTDPEKSLNIAQKTADILKKEIATKGMVDVGKGVEHELGITRNKLDEAITMLELEGYNTFGVGLKTGVRKQTNTQVLAKPGDAKKQIREAYQDPEKIKSVGDYHSKDGGQRWDKREYPASIKSSRIKVQYGDEGGADKDGVIELRRGVADLDLGKSHYAQVRILVDGTHYLKGMAMYSDDIPDGVDIVFNTNKKKGTPKMDVLKKIQDDPDNPFGAYIKADGQSYYTDPKTGKKKLSAINKLKEEGDWDVMSKNLSSQFLSKQPIELIRKQLKLTYSDKQSEYDEIMSLTNPTVKKQLLKDFADSCDADAVHMKAAALPRQQSRVILPVTKLKDNEVYAPYLNNGEKVVLIRYPHGGTFELPELTVNNKNTAAKRILGNAIDAIGINSKVAERLSGADFDGDSVVVIPVNNRVRIKTSAALEALKDFDPKVEYSTEGKTGVRLMKKGQQTQNQMGQISNLITDMTLRGAPTDEIARAVKHSMVVIDAAKHKLDYKQSEKDQGIAELKKKWQPKYDDNGNVVGSGGASTLLSRRKQTVEVPERRGSGRINPDTGEVEYNTSGRTYVNNKGKTVSATTKVSLVQNIDDVRKLSSGTLPENAYADYSNKMKAMANQARKEYTKTPRLEYSPTAAKAYAKEVSELNAALNIAHKDAPKQRRAQAIANSVVKAKVQAHPELSEKANKKDLEKIKRAALDDARFSVGASSKDRQINITNKQWEAIQAGAISDTKLKEILRFSDSDRIRELAMPKTTTTLSTAKLTKMKAMKASGYYTIADIANALGVSTSTVSKYLNS